LAAWWFAFLLALVILISTTLIGFFIKEPKQKPFESKSRIRQYKAAPATTIHNID
jgi:hypothetical protein